MSDVVQTVRLPPDPGLVASLGATHSLATAVSDVVDNAVDAGARNVLIVLETQDDRLVRVRIVDDGRGMDDSVIDSAMTLGLRRDYDPADLGHFGLGMKAAAFAHADTLTVWSTSRLGEPVGRRIRRADFSRDFSCEILSTAAAAGADLGRRRCIDSLTGTVVEWTDLSTAYRGSSDDEALRWLDKRVGDLRVHLGYTFHRLIERDALHLATRRDERDMGEGIPEPVPSIDPLGYRTSGHPNHPKTLVARVGDRQVPITCHVWPPKSEALGYRLGRRSGEELQGFFVYRADRLLQVGGWSGVVTPDSKRRLARVVLEGDAIGYGLTMNPEKRGLRFEPGFVAALHDARAADGSDFSDYLEVAELVQVQASKRNRDRKPAVMAEKGLGPTLRQRIRRELPDNGQEPLSFLWAKASSGDLFEIDFEARTVRLNPDYRAAFVGARGSLNDAPFLKAALYLLTHHVFEGRYLGSRDKDEIALFQAVLTAAAQAELRAVEARD